jgi:hypothetical protein
MTTAIDELPTVGVSRLRAAGRITPLDKTTTISFGDSDVSFTVGVAHLHFPNGGDWAFFLCPGPGCGRRARTLRLFEGNLACKHCLKARGIHYRVELFSHRSKRTPYVVSRLLARLNSTTPARLHPSSPGQMLDRRARLEAALRRSLIAARQFALDEHDQMLAKLMEDK